MSIYKASLQTVQDSVSDKTRPVNYNGTVFYARSVYVPTGSEASGSVIELGTIPEGSRLLALSEVHFEAGQNASLTVKVGDADDDDRYFASAAPGASAVTKKLAGNARGDHLVTQVTKKILLTTGGAALTASKKIVADLYYVCQ